MSQFTIPFNHPEIEKVLTGKKPPKAWRMSEATRLRLSLQTTWRKEDWDAAWRDVVAIAPELAHSVPSQYLVSRFYDLPIVIDDRLSKGVIELINHDDSVRWTFLYEEAQS